MTLRPFELRSASSLKEALAVLAERGGGAAAIAGGTDLLGALKDNIHPDYPEVLVDLKRIPGLAGVRPSGRGVSIGSLTTLADLAKDPRIRSRYPALAEAAASAASPQIRNAATVGGNICQEPRCWYYRSPDNAFHCMRKGGDRCAALLGDHRFHSAFGAARVASPACASACPGRVEIPVYLECVRRGDLGAAARIVLERNPMPAVTGRVCPHRCEAACNRGDLDEALAIRAVELSVGSHALERPAEFWKAPSSLSRKRVAVVGSGPAGLSAACYLRRAGLGVTVFERMPEPGGMLAYGIPGFRLPPAVLARQIAAYRAMGMELRTGVSVGTDIPLERLRKDFHAVFVAPGAWRAKGLSIPGAELLQSGLDLLRDVRLGRPVKIGRRVLVIGGGSVALDVALTCRRLGAAEVAAVCLESQETMPAFPEDVAHALEEGVKLMPSWGPRRVLARGGKASGVEFVRCVSVLDAAGRFNPRFDESVRRVVEADQAWLAIGQAPDLSLLGGKVRSSRGLIAADPETGETSLAKVFAGGDAVSGPASVVEALAAGRRAAQAIIRGLGAGRGCALPAGAGEPKASGRAGSWTAVNVPALAPLPRTSVPRVPAGERRIDEEDCRVIDDAMAQGEARRCVDCSCVAVNSSDLGPVLIALGAAVKTTRRRLPAERFFDARPRRSTALEQGELVTAVELPAPRPGARQAYRKFRLRRSIDFPVVSVASVLELKGGRIANARVAFGAAAPVPLRAAALEEFLAGRALTRETADAAAEAAVQGAAPLARNGYKLQVLKALVRRMILPEPGTG